MNLIKRILAAVVAIPIILPILIYAPPLATYGVLTAAVFIALGEYFGMTFKEDALARRFGTVVGTLLFALWGAAIVFKLDPSLYPLGLLVAFVGLFFFFLFRIGDMQTVGTRAAMAVFGVIYIDLLAIYLVALHNLERGWAYLILLFAIVWLNDTGAYFAGRGFGRTKFYEAVSPKKTWEGSFGGMAFSIGGAFLFDWMLSTGIGWAHLLTLAVVAGYLGQIGDLCESLIKRSYGIKDSGSIIPGHGGILDRIDALLFAAPFAYYFLVLIVLG